MRDAAFFEILLVIIFRAVEGWSGSDLRDDGPAVGAALFERGDGVGVRHAHEGRVDERFEPGDALLVDPLGEEFQIVTALVEQRREDVLEKRFRQVGIGREIGKGDLGLDHPELGEVAAGVAVLGAERRSERVDL